MGARRVAWPFFARARPVSRGGRLARETWFCYNKCVRAPVAQADRAAASEAVCARSSRAGGTWSGKDLLALKSGRFPEVPDHFWRDVLLQDGSWRRRPSSGDSTEADGLRLFPWVLLVRRLSRLFPILLL